MKDLVVQLTLWTLFGALTNYGFAGIMQIEPDSSGKPKLTHGSKGMEFVSADGLYSMQVQGRLQFRFATPADQDPATFDDFSIERRNIFKVNRARLKIGGHAYQPWLKYYFEYELGQSNLLDFRVMIEKYKWLSLKVGQWKADYNRERMISSGEQQMVERSLLTKPFTLDRQQGVAIYGHLDGPPLLNFNYAFSVLTGNGRGSRTNDDRSLMYVGRVQWNLLGEPIEMSGGDLERTPKPALLIAAAGSTNRSSFTRFSQSGGGQLTGFSDGVAGQYDLKQYVIETAFKFKGLSWQHESHVKRINDRLEDTNTDMTGSYFQLGYFLDGIVPKFPKKLEIAGRYALFRPDKSLSDNLQKEYSLATNYFFFGHKNKLTMEYAIVSFQAPVEGQTARNRFRIQWEISF